MKKRGVSTLVASVLVILAVVAFVSILWFSISSIIDIDVSHYDSSVSVETGEGYTFYDDSPGNEKVTIQLESKGKDPFERVQVLFLMSAGYVLESFVNAPAINSKTRYTFDFSGLGEPLSVSVAPVFGEVRSENVGRSTSEVKMPKRNEDPNYYPPESLDPNSGCYIDDDGACDTGDLGVCSFGSRECVDGVWGECLSVNEASGEVCNGLDDDCNGLVDDDVSDCSGSTPYCYDGGCVGCITVDDCVDRFCFDKSCTSGTCTYVQSDSCIYFDDFESGLDGWEHGSLGESDTWHTGDETCFSRDLGSVSVGTHGNNCGASNFEYSYLLSPEIRLSEVSELSSVSLVFSSWAYDEGGACLDYGDYDSKEVGVSLDGGETWNVLNDCYSLHYPEEGVWLEKEFDLSSYIDDDIRIIFVYNSFDDCCGFEEGWYVDNFVVQKNG